jgi:hypothetical protein
MESDSPPIDASNIRLQHNQSPDCVKIQVDFANFLDGYVP